MSPAAGATVAAGTIAVTIEFDEPMLPQMGFRKPAIEGLEATGHRFPAFAGVGVWSADERTIVHECVELEAGRKYAVPIGENFRDISGNPAQEFIWTIDVAGGG